MNYPIWDLPSGGLLIAAIAVLHVYISHFAVGGGLFLVLAERRARRLADAQLLGYVRRFSRFFVLLTLVLGAVTGVGIWFTIGLVHPQATSALITAFVWAWAIEWTFFLAEIVAALVYHYGWDRLDPKTHERVGWLYFVNAWLSLAVINGILAFMLTPGAWIASHELVDGFFNPTYLPSLVTRTFGAVGLAGLYAVAVAAWSSDARMKEAIARYAGLWWVVPMALAVPASLVWYLAAAAGAGVPVGDILGSASGGLGALVRVVLDGSPTGQPVVQRAVLVTVAAAAAVVALVVAMATVQRRSYGRPLGVAVIAAGLLTIGGAEWTREGLRKPYVIGQHMFVNGVRLPPREGVPAPPSAEIERFGSDPYTVEALDSIGVLPAARWTRLPDPLPGNEADAAVARGRELFRLQCRACHSESGYLAVRPLVEGKSQTALDGLLDRLARPVEEGGGEVAWNAPGLRLETWRGRQMPPLVGTRAERADLAAFLAVLGGARLEPPGGPAAAAGTGAALFEELCAACHGPDGAWPLAGRAGRRSAETFYEMLGRLPEVNDMMPAFEGTDDQRRALASHLAALDGPEGGVR